MNMRLAALAFGLLAAPAATRAAAIDSGGATPSQLLAQGYTLVAASSNGQTQYIYLQGTDSSGMKKIYACQLMFGSTGGFQGCLALP